MPEGQYLKKDADVCYFFEEEMKTLLEEKENASAMRTK